MFINRWDAGIPGLRETSSVAFRQGAGGLPVKSISLFALIAALSGCAVVPDGMLAYRPATASTFEAPVRLDLPAAGATLSPAQEMYPFAAMSENVYHPHTAGDAPVSRTPDRLESACVKGGAEALPIGSRWLMQGFPSDSDELDDVHNLRIQLWGRKPPDSTRIEELVVVFRGTEARHGQDWYANLRWLMPWRVDHYTLTSGTIATELQAWLQEKIAAGDVAPDVKLVATGHSLGGGLAQQMAYAFRAPTNAGTLRFDRVYAFDPSPVTGWVHTDQDLRKRNASGLQTDRILEDGEALSYLRTVLGIFLQPSGADPAIRGVKFNFKHSYNPFSNHSMRLIACSLAKYMAPDTIDIDTRGLEAE
ncbi:MAG: hypothetical protein ABI887_06560 [Burkholderiales bacterium]